MKSTKEDYLRAIYHLIEENNDENVKSVDLSKYLEIAKSSVSEMLKKLMKNGLIRQSHYGKITLTKKGFIEAKKVTRMHRIIESFLMQILKMDSKKIHEEAHRLEHAFSKDAIFAIENLIKDTKSCPHGKPIPYQ